MIVTDFVEVTESRLYTAERQSRKAKVAPERRSTIAATCMSHKTRTDVAEIPDGRSVLKFWPRGRRICQSFYKTGCKVKAALQATKRMIASSMIWEPRSNHERPIVSVIL